MYRESTERVLATGREFIGLLDEMATEYRPEHHPHRRWVVKHRELISRWVNRLEAASSPRQVNELWMDMQARARILENATPDEFGRRYRALKSTLFRHMAELVAEVRER